jgi:Concanavalin A-like lectin/glucanases superfamily/HYR domain
MKSDAPARTQLDFGTTRKRQRALRLVLVVISIATFLGFESIGPSPQITPHTSAGAPFGAPPASCAAAPAGLVSWWPGDGNATDIMPSPDNGTLNGGATFAAGEVLQAFSLNGTTAYVSAPDAPKINFGVGDFSIDAWIKTSNASTTQAIIDKRSGDNVSVFTGYHLFTFGGNLGVQLADGLGGGITATNFVSATNVADGAFHHVAVTVVRNSATGGNLYVDGVSVLTFNPTGRPGSLTNTAELRIGRNCPNTLADNFFNGLVDEVELFDRAVSAAELQAIFNAGSLGKCKGCATPPANMVGWWPANGNASDITPSPDNGTLNGTANFASGEVLQAFSLDGTTAYVSAPDAPKINFGTGDFSIDAWIKTSNANGVQVIVDKRVGNNVTTFTGYSLFTFNGNLGAQLADGTALNFVSVTNVADGAFHHVAVTVVRNSATGGNLYVDGVSVLTFDPTVRPGSLTNNAELRIGRNSPNTILDTFFNGLIDEVELFNRALSAAEVQAIFNAGSQGKCPCTITCPANITKSNDPNQCGAVVTYPAPTFSSGCGNVLCSPASGLFFPVGTTTVTCSTTAGPNCTFTVKVNDTQPPVITCPANQTAVTNQSACPSPACQVVNFPAPTASDNCPGVVVVCNPAAGSCFPVGATTVTCTATDTSGNTATCSFTVTTFDVALQDDSNPSIILLWNSITGQYRFCCNGMTFTGVGMATRQGCIYTLQHNPADRRVLGREDKSVHAGSASLQNPPGTIRCTITDRNTLNDTLLPACQ